MDYSNDSILRQMCILLCGCLVLLTATVQAAETESPRFALLIGVEKYANLSPGEQLNGCANDVAAMQSLLKQRFGFADEQIRTLVNSRATGKAIRAELQRLAEQIRALPAGSDQAQVVFHFSGHGSQVLDQKEGSDRDEDDGLDETLVPYDASKQGGSEDIRDDELFRFVERICAGGKARMWLVLDCCHSGTGARGTAKTRKLSRGLTVNPPPTEEARKFVKKRLPAGAVALSACRAREVEPEYEVDGKSYGLMTRFVAQVLGEEENVSRLSYDLLRQSLLAHYRQDSRVMLPPMPQLEGDPQLMQGAVLGATGVDRKPYRQVQLDGSNRGTALLKAGSFHGVTVGSLYEVYTLPEHIVWNADAKSNARNGESLAWLVVENVEGATAKVRVLNWQGDQQIDARLPSTFKEGFAVERFHQHGDFGLRLRVVEAIDRHSDGPALTRDSKRLPTAVGQALASIQEKGESSWLQWTAAGQECDLVLRVDGHYAALFPATGVAHVEPSKFAKRGDVPRSLVGGWGPIDLRKSADAAAKLKDYLRRITRARNLIRLSAAQASLSATSRGGGSSPVQVKLELVVVDSFDDDEVTVKKAHSWKADQEGGNVMRDLATYAYRVVNLEKSGKPIYVTVLHIDSDMGIDQVLPWQDGADVVGEQKFAPGEERYTDAFDCNADKDEPPVYGHRRAIVLATREPNFFYMLQQPGLPKVRGGDTTRIVPGGAVRDRGPQSLELLLLEQAYFQPATRGGAKRRRPQKLFDQSWSAASVEWLVVPGK